MKEARQSDCQIDLRKNVRNAKVPPLLEGGNKYKYKEKACMPGLHLVRFFFLFLLGLLFLTVNACTNTPETADPEFVIKTGSNIVFPEEFAKARDLKLAAYPYDLQKNPEEYNQMIFDLVSVLSEESLLLAAAFDEKILVTRTELLSAVALQREDYPEDSFEQMLLENAISYSYWEKVLKKNLIIDKFIQQELKDKIEILPGDVVSFYNQHINQEIVSDENKLLEHLRLKKSQESYDGWITVLKERYPVDINEKVLTKFLIKTGK